MIRTQPSCLDFTFSKLPLLFLPIHFLPILFHFFPPFLYVPHLFPPSLPAALLRPHLVGFERTWTRRKSHYQPPPPPPTLFQ